MKLYTKHQIIGTAAISAVCAAAVFGGIYFFSEHIQKKQERKSGAETYSSVRKNDPQFAADTMISSGKELSIPSDTTSFELNTASGPEPVFAADASSDYTIDETQNILVYERCNEAVVNINTQIMAINWFLEPVPQDGGSGSGSIIDTRGYVVTNVHVIQNAYKIYISLSDGTQYEGTVIGTDSASDIAVIKFDPPKGMELKTISFADSSKLKVGQKVIAIGNPFGLERTMTTGIVSGLGRPIQSSKDTIIRDMIQTDTAINPGNSGGPLLDTKGRMIGINTMIYSTSGSSAGVGFAVPVNTAKRVVSDLIQYGSVRRGIIEARFVQMNSSIARYAGVKISQGLLVSEIKKGSSAEKAGLRAGTEAAQYGSRLNPQIIYLGGDIITAINGIPTNTFADYYSVLESKRPGDVVAVSIRRGNHDLDIQVRLAEEK
ncbi:MAG: trypsin-like peptidase domain-containing protein [Bacteroides sp.]|nr:trypsin-like peptidase domain-containing protein [Prevotella sp.]MCM1407155.1 trypsin-like peptidase domain-containing protein [Treponema brennaborense]MCM1470307.1 trypsin-like peptidase domain-containing protein [Bacteroides sp.]